VPADDAEAVADGRGERVRVEAPVAVAGDRQVAHRARVADGDDAEQSLHLIRFGDQVGVRGDVAAAQPEPDLPAVLEVERPPSATRGQQRLTVTRVAHRLQVRLAGKGVIATMVLLSWAWC
jgi:hypothetical protein